MKKETYVCVSKLRCDVKSLGSVFHAQKSGQQSGMWSYALPGLVQGLNADTVLSSYKMS